jgi:DNA-binding IclR family transcriptional regulator
MYQASSTNATEKVCKILKVMSTPLPLRLADIAEKSEVNQATALRILDTLIKQGFVERDAVGKRYMLGKEALVLGIAMQGRDHIRDRARPALVRLAALTGDTVILSTRHGLESVCIDREYGSFPIRANYLDFGSRRPLGAGAGSLALLSWLPQDEAQTVVKLIAPILKKNYPLITTKLLNTKIEESKKNGYALLLDVVIDQMGGIGVPIFGPDGKPQAALSIAALTRRITSRLDVLVPALKNAATEISSFEALRPNP